MTPDQKYITGLTSFGILITYAASTTYCPDYLDGWHIKYINKFRWTNTRC